MLDLVEGGQHFRCTIDLKTGEATLSAVGIADFSPTATTSVRGPGEYRVAFANVDDQLLLWVDGDLVEFEGGTAYDVGPSLRRPQPTSCRRRATTIRATWLRPASARATRS